MKRILVFGMTENPGGVESFLLNYYRCMDRSQLQFDFLCNSHKPVAYEDELIALGGRMYHIAMRSKNPKLYQKELKEVFRNHSTEWSAIWVNVSSLANIDYLKIAKKYGLKKRIIHSHNSRNMDSRLRGLLHFWNKRYLDRYATDFWACAQDAAHWFYRDDLMSQVKIIHNAIDVDRLCYDAEKRREIREKLGIREDTFVLGNVGRLHFQKNQSFAIDIFREYLKINSDSILILVGQGEDVEILKEKAKDLKDKVLFVGAQKDIQAWLSSFDLFIFPSVFEGLSIAALEAQANGIPALASEGVITREAVITENFFFYSLKRTSKEWAEKIEELRLLSSREEPDTVKELFVKSEYEISTEAQKLERLLME